MHNMKLKLIVLFTLLCSNRLAVAENNSVKDIVNKILTGQDIEVLDAVYDTDKLHLQQDDLIQLYIELLDYHIGAGPGEILGEKVTKMGDKILPFLVEKENTPLRCSEKYKKRCCRDMKERNVHIDSMIEAIREGTVLYAVFPEGLKTEAEKDLKIIKIFLEDFRLHRKSLPKDLQALKDYTWQQYGYKLKILNPWGEAFKYLLRGRDKYILEVGKEPPD